ncbi:ABC transporter permease [Primorskyibacter flagellatus]|uniref:Peptide/nickel transport system permease protein n=1 Tax=Primorskyibacter flagellatus TaxID=1387277 RepID=A0A1W2DYA2_9RHOB|nr:ABC transporter permease [Primorskyibacter flagellatus]SMD02484.1 peptide/nickel transport system permease protein [Primorskyibacter flagellatus]
MLNFITRRLGQSAVLVLVMSALVFVGMYVISDPVAVLAGEDFTEADRQALAAELGVDRPLIVQYFNFLGNVIRGDFGSSFVYNRPVMDLILEKLPATLEVAFLAMFIGLVVGIPLGVYSGLNQKKPATKTISFATTVGYSIPNFWQGVLLIMLFAVWLQILPASGRGDTVEVFGVGWSMFSLNGLSHMILPALNLAIYTICLQARLARSGTQEVMYQDFMTFARAKGISRERIVRRHLVRNILIPIVTITGLQLGGLIAFATVTETVFSWPGIGKLLLDSIHNSDRPVVVAYLILITLMFVTINFIVDVTYALLDPRIRYT